MTLGSILSHRVQLDIPSAPLVHSFTETCSLPHEERAVHECFHLHWPSPTYESTQKLCIFVTFLSSAEELNCDKVGLHGKMVPQRLMHLLLRLCHHSWHSSHSVIAYIAQFGLIWDAFWVWEQGILWGTVCEQGHDRLACWEQTAWNMWQEIYHWPMWHVFISI